MVDITHKNNTLRKAIASATITVSRQATIDAVVNKLVPKGDVFEFSRAAGLLAVKKTSDAIPDCHPLPVEYTAITYSIEGLSIFIQVEVHTVYKTGVEVEAMHGAAITAITIYDMLKPLDKGVEISTIKLVNKQGGKSSFNQFSAQELKCAVIVCSDSISNGQGEDRSGKLIIDKLAQLSVECNTYKVIPDDFVTIQSIASDLCQSGFDLVIFSGGTGLSIRDVTPDALTPMITKPIPGIMEAVRNYGQQRMPYAMLSRGVAGFIDETLFVTLPGSIGGVQDAVHAIFPHLLHVFQVKHGFKHD
jgi:cyclic pyranopterin monophosphate synthase